MDRAQLLQTFRTAYQNLELFPLITDEQIRDFRVEYGNDTIAKLEQAVEDAPKNGKLIFSGHRGCGKSTLMARFSHKMSQQGYFVAFFSIGDLVELSAVDHVNILYSIALSLMNRAIEEAVPIPEDVQQALRDWFTTTETETTTKDLKSEVGVGGNFLQFLIAKLRNENTFRQEIKRTFERRISELARKADEIASVISAFTGKEILVIIDDLDKLDLDLVEGIYKNNINSLFLPNFRIIFTIPISAIRNSELMAVLNAKLSRIRQFEVCKFYKYGESHDPNALPIASKVDLFLKILQRRIPSGLIEPETAQSIVLKSGGVVRELVRIARECCSQCLLKLRSEAAIDTIKIDDEILRLALRDLRNDFSRPLGLKLYNLLVEVYQNFKPEDATSEEFLSLLHGLYVLEYENDKIWYDLHPIVVDLLKQEGRL